MWNSKIVLVLVLGTCVIFAQEDANGKDTGSPDNVSADKEDAGSPEDLNANADNFENIEENSEPVPGINETENDGRPVPGNNEPPGDEQPPSSPDDPSGVPPLSPRTIPGAGGAVYNARENYVDYNQWDSLNSRYAPPLHSQRGGIKYVITEQRLKEIRSHFMYWFYDKGDHDNNNGDFQHAIQNSNPQVHKNLNFQLPFFGFRFNYTRVSIHGYLEFSDPPETYPSYPLVFPNKDWPAKNDPSFMGIFFSRCRIGVVKAEDVDQRLPGVYFRLERDLPTRIDQLGVEMFERIKWDIREGVIGADSFIPKHAITVTWKNVSFAGGIVQSLGKTNTFQLVLATDEVFTYAIFNYLDLQWTTHTEAGGDTLSGEGGVPAFIGFNAGNGTRSFEYLPYSQASVLRDLSGRGWANGFPGRHIFRIDENILLGTCNKDIDGANLPLMFAPESGNMLGGTVVNITGPCFEKTDKVLCKFDVEDEVEGTVVDSNRAVCVQPRLSVEGYVRFEIAIGSGKYKWKGKYFVETPGSAAEKIFFDDSSVHEKNPGTIRITWVANNLTTNTAANVRISLWGYRESTIRPEFLYIGELDTVQNQGVYDINPGMYRNRNQEKLLDLPFGFIHINLTDPLEIVGTNSKITPVIWSRPIPLGWYFGSQWENKYGSDWPDKLCDNWIKNDRYLKNFAHELPQCPCTLMHALSDKGRYMPDFDCDKDANPKCQYNRGAMHCVRSGSPTLEGSEQKCCYDKMGYLTLSYDQQWGSSPHRSHNLGFLPWNEPNKVPTLSHWFNDMVPRYFCCLWQGEQAVGCETLRFERRPSQNCVAYQSPGVAGVFGDPHVITFDSTEYTFNGKGEFALVRVNDKSNRLEVQGRFEQMTNNPYGEVRATQLTSVVARGNSSTIVEVRMRPEYAQWRYRLDVFADGKRVFFDRPALKFQHFPGVLVYTPTYILNQSEVLIMFDSGAGVEVIENKGYMSARVYLPWTFINKTRGLFGNWSFTLEDEFTRPDGEHIPVQTNVNDFERVYNDFGIHWMLEDKEDKEKGGALFYREFGRTSSYYNNRTFKPEFRVLPEDLIPQNRSIEIEKAYDLCGRDEEEYQCRYDYAMTYSRDLAHFTHNYRSSIYNIKEINAKQIVSCGVLETPRFGRKTNFLFIPGTKVTFECDQEFTLIGDPRRECMADGSWDVPKYGYTQCLRQQEYSSRQAGITAGIVMAVMIPLLLLLIYGAYVFLSKRKNYEMEDEDAYEQQKRRAQQLAEAKLRAAETDDEEASSLNNSSIQPHQPYNNSKETTVY